MRGEMRRDSGMVGHWIVIAFSIAIGGFVLASQGSIRPFYPDQQPRRHPDEAFAPPDPAVALARAELDREGRAPELVRVPLGRGHVSLHVEKADEHEVVVVATGTVPAGALAGKGGTLTRRVRARFAL